MGAARPTMRLFAADEAGDKGRLRPVVQILGRSQLFEAPVTHHAHMIRQHQGFRLIMGDVHEGGAEGGLQLLEFDLHVLAQFQIESTQGFVEQQQSRFQHQAACDGHALALTAGQFIHAFGAGASQTDPIQHGLAAPYPLGAFHAAPGETECNVFPHRHHGEQRQLLKYHIDGAAIRRHFAHALSADDDVARVRRDESGNHAQQGRLSAPGRTQYGKETSALDGKRQ